jgi:putative acetyltransferase
VIRVAAEDDWAAIVEVHRRAFGGDDVPLLVQRLREGGYDVPSLSFVAEADGRVVGNAMNSWVSVEGDERPVLQLSPVGVVPEYQRRGLGSQLVRAALGAVHAFGEPLLLVEGSPRYYGRFGFVRADGLGLLPPPGSPDWAFQVAVLDDAAQLPRGRVIYSPPFEIDSE